MSAVEGKADIRKYGGNADKGPPDEPPGEDGHLTALRPSRLELIAAGNPENLDVLLAPVYRNR
jgi:hypothetical protein